MHCGIPVKHFWAQSDLLVAMPTLVETWESGSKDPFKNKVSGRNDAA